MIVLCHRGCDGWAGGIESYPGTAAQLDRMRLAFTVSDAVALRCDQGTYYLTVSLETTVPECRSSSIHRRNPCCCGTTRRLEAAASIG